MANTRAATDTTDTKFSDKKHANASKKNTQCMYVCVYLCSKQLNEMLNTNGKCSNMHLLTLPVCTREALVKC